MTNTISERTSFSAQKSNSGIALWPMIAIGICSLFPGSILRPANLQAQNESKAAANSPLQNLSIGFDGQVLLGKWVPYQLTFESAGLAISGSAKVVLETLDGDAVPIRYTSVLDDSGTSQISGLIRMGRASGVTVSILSVDESEIIAERRFSLDELSATHSFLPGTSKLAVVLGIDQQEHLERFNLDRKLADEVVMVSDFSGLPDRWIGYESVRMLIVAPATDKSIMTTKQSDAIGEWIRLGGRMVLTSGDSIESFFGNEGMLKSLMPGTIVERRMIRETGSIELLTGLNEPLVRPSGPALPITVIEVPADQPVASTVAEVPLIVHRPSGFGKISFIGLDFLSEPLADWAGQKRLLSIAGSDFARNETESSVAQTGRVSHIGYEDIAGQLRAGMDQYSNVSFITFTSVALLVALFILAIGPGDYLFLRRLTGRMELTWLTFSILSLAFCGLAFLIVNSTKSSNTEMNQVELIDLDASEGSVRGTLWANLYSPGTETYELAIPESNSLFGAIDDRWLSWQGLPGKGLGSMQSKTDLGLYRRKYDCLIDDNASTLHSVPMQNASTKTLVGQWTGHMDEVNSGTLRQSQSSDALLGTITNPMNVNLYNCAILYGDWVYILENRPLAAGETIVVEDDMREKTIGGHFTRLSSGRGKDEVNAAWDPAGTSLPAIVQMMSFFEAIGGETYTRLTNDFHARLDLSHQMQTSRAVLIGQIGQATTPINVNGQPFAEPDKKLTVLRIVFPVQLRKEKSRRR